MQERLQKILARGGLASRRAAEQLLAEGRVRVNGKIVTELGSKADPRADKIEVDGKRVVAEDFVYAVLHKPRGVVSTLSDPEGRPTVREYLGALDARCYPVGRLDFATSGVLLITNDGAFSDGLLHPKKAVPKTYVVKANGTMKPEDLRRWETGVRLEDGTTTGKATVDFLRHEGDKTWFELTISEGKNQQIRRMGVATGFPVMRLSRLSFAGVTSEGLRPGALRMLTLDEMRSLREAYGVPKRVRAPRELAAPSRVDRRRPRPESASRVEKSKRESAQDGERRGRGAFERGERPARERASQGESAEARRGAGAGRPEATARAGRGVGRERTERGAGPARSERGPARGGDRGPARGGERSERGPARGERAGRGGERTERGPARARSGERGEAPRAERPARTERGSSRGGGERPQGRPERPASGRGAPPRERSDRPTKTTRKPR